MSDTIVRSHLAHSSIRAQATRRKQPTKETKKDKAEQGDRQSVKAVLGSPWTVQWDGEGEDLVEELCEVVGEVRGFHAGREKRRRGEFARAERNDRGLGGDRRRCGGQGSCSWNRKWGSL